MKKIFIASLSALFIFALAGCSGMPTGPRNSQALVDKAQSSLKKIDSYSVTTTATMDVTSAHEKHKTTATTVVNVQKKPYMVHMTRKVVNDKDPSKAQMMDVYMTKQAVYMKSAQGQTSWKKVSSKESKSLNDLLEANSGDLDLELKKVDQYTNSLAVSNNGDNYLASFTGKGKEFNNFTDELAKSQLPQSNELRTYLSNVNENHVEYYYSFDNKKYRPQNMELIMDMTVKNPDHVSDNLNVTYHSTSKFSKYNNVSVNMPGKMSSGMMQ